jgi:NTP pyrophosphatase (non-canonical NTP hydrolase)
VAGKIKKVYRDKRGEYTTEDLDAIEAELGDVLWYLSTTATELGISLESIARKNIVKLSSRKLRGVLGGSGDKR